MQMIASQFTKNDLAKYPFLKESTEYVKKLSLKVEDLANPEFAAILERAEERLEEAILYSFVSNKTRNDEIEILSFPVAIMLALATENSFIKKRYAIAESKRAYETIRLEPTERVLAVAQNFGWRLSSNSDRATPYEFALNFADYLRNITHLREKKWKLINRLLVNGKVYLTRSETARLLSEEVRGRIEKRLEVKGLPKFPSKIAQSAEKIKKLSLEKIGKNEMESFPKVMVEAAFPPCIESLYQAFSSGRHLSHIGRFTLTSFLVSIGMPTESVIELFKNISDFNERMTRYQVEHIAGERGSRTSYVPPRCDTLRTHGVCMSPDELCKKVRHPLNYYRIRLKTHKSRL
jgi:DNA primase large subunit